MRSGLWYRGPDGWYRRKSDADRAKAAASDRLSRGNEKPDIRFFLSGSVEMLRIANDGFYVRGVKVEQGPGEAEAVYRAFLDFMHNIPCNR